MKFTVRGDLEYGKRDEGVIKYQDEEDRKENINEHVAQNHPEEAIL